MATDDSITVEVVAGDADSQRLIELVVPGHATVADAIAESKILRFFPALSSEGTQYGIWGKLVALDQTLQDGDRIELYRALKIEPREARRQLAAIGKTMREGSGEPK